MPLIRRVPTLALAAAIAALLSAAPPAAHAEDGGVAWTVQTADNGNGAGRANFSYDVEPGAVLTDTMIVVNTGTEPLPLAVYAADAFTASSGEIDVLVDGTPSQGAGTWVRVDTDGLELAPGQSADVPFTVSIPADARPGDHTAGIVTSLTTTDASSSLSVDRRLGTRINLRVAGELAPAAAVSEVRAEYHPTWNPFAAGTLTVRYALENTGNTRVTGAETVSTTGTLGLLGTSTPPAQLSEVVPGSTVEIARDIPAFSIGWINGSVRVAPEGVGLGAGSVGEVVVDFAVPAVPWSLYALIGLLAAAAVGLLLLIRRRGAGARPGDAQAT